MADIKTEKTVAEELREAAARLRRVATGTTEGRWVCGRLEEQEDFSQQVAVSAEHALVAEINLRLADASWRYMRARAVRDGQWIALASPALAEPLASWLDLAAGRYDEDVYEDEIGCNPGGTHGDFCEADCPGHKPVAICDRCGNRVGPDAPEGSRCGCWDKALAVARVLNGTSP
jgi:hypothetical protein